MADEPGTFDEWCLVELMGHRRIAARVTDVTIAGHGFLRLDVPADDGPGRPGSTQLVNPTSVYAIHPTTEEVARAMADTWHHEPVQRWELPDAKPQPRMLESDYDDDERDRQPPNGPEPF